MVIGYFTLIEIGKLIFYRGAAAFAAPARPHGRTSEYLRRRAARFSTAARRPVGRFRIAVRRPRPAS